MDRFCIRQMRKEYRGVIKACCASAVVLLLAGACLGAVAQARHADSRVLILLLGVQLFIVISLLGMYLILSDEKRLIRQTPFGRSLQRLGDPERLIADIDKSARKGLERHGAYTLTQDWLILEYPCAWRWEPMRKAAMPVPREMILGVRGITEKNPDDPEERHMQIVLSDETLFDLYVYQQQDAQALLSWLGESEWQADE